MIKCVAFSASVCDRTLEQSVTSNQVGGGRGEDIKLSSLIDVDSILAMAESRVASFVTELQNLSSSRRSINLRK